MKYRIYADGSVIDENDFAEKDNAQPYYDDFQQITVPDVVVEYIENTMVDT